MRPGLAGIRPLGTRKQHATRSNVKERLTVKKNDIHPSDREKVVNYRTAASKRKGDGMVAPIDGSNRTRNTLLN